MSRITAINTFDYPEFKPPWWAFNTHIHTILPSLADTPVKPEHTKHEISTPDGDFLEVDMCELKNSKPVVALFHGLEGSSDRYYINNLMTHLKSAGYSSAALNFRGCGSRLNNKRRFYHSGETQDYHTFIEWLQDFYPGKSVYAVGYSLGGNALVKFLSEQKSVRHVVRAAVVSPPYDLKKGSYNLQQGFNQMYEQSFLKTLVEKLEDKRNTFPDLPRFSGSNIYDFDNQITAPLHDFSGADDYYEQCSSKNFYKDVDVPLLIIHSKEDTLCPVEYAPLDEIEENPCIQTIFTEKGGHVGFISSPPHWLERTIVRWLENSS